MRERDNSSANANQAGEAEMLEQIAASAVNESDRRTWLDLAAEARRKTVLGPKSKL